MAILARCDHPNVVKLEECIWDEDSFRDLYLVLEYVNSDLGKLIQSGNRIFEVVDPMSSPRNVSRNLSTGAREVHLAPAARCRELLALRAPDPPGHQTRVQSPPLLVLLMTRDTNC